MSATRKAVITTAQVQEALNEMNTLKAEIGLPVLGNSFGKGARGMGFAVYTDESATAQVVESFSDKESAYVKFSQFVEVGNIILGASHVKVVKPEPAKTVKKATEQPAA